MLELKNINSGGLHVKKLSAKSIMHISGSLVFPIKEGARSVILYCGRIIRTPQVTKILEQSEYKVCFETERCVYNVSLIPHSNVAQTLKCA